MLMKKSILLLMAAATAAGAGARTLTPEEALTRAMKTENAGAVPMRVKTLTTKQAVPVLTVRSQAAEEPAVYVFGAGDGGYLVVSADDVAPAVLGYGDDGAQLSADNMPPAMRYWLDSYAAQIAYARSNGAGEYVKGKAPERAAIAPMVTTRWNQDAPYNDDCPEVGGVRCVTGCVATALAQVLNYHKYPTKGTGTKSYSWNGQTLSFDYGSTTFEWGEMSNTYGSESTAAQKKTVATLMYACGVGVKMQYTTQESGATTVDVPGFLVDNMGYSKSTRYVPRDYYGLSEWEDVVYNNLKEYGATQYSGQSNEGGHSFVCDGYDKDGYFHINWGWGGMSDGYFLLTALDPETQGIGGSNSGFNFSQDIIAGMKPASEGDVAVPNLYCDNGIEPMQTTVQKGASVAFAGNVINYGISEAKGTMGIKITNAAGESVYSAGSSNVSLPSMTYVQEFGAVVPSDLPDGTYTVTPAFRDSEGAWHDIRIAMSAPQKVIMTVSGNTVTFSEAQPPQVTVTNVKAESEFYSGSNYLVSATVTNTGDSEYYGNICLLFLTDAGTITARGAYTTLDLQPGESQELSYLSGYMNVQGSAVDMPAGTYRAFFGSVDSQSGEVTELSPMINVTVKEAAATVLSAGAPTVENAEAVDASSMKASAQVTCSEGYFGGTLTLVIFPYSSSGGSVSNVGAMTSAPVFIKAGETVTVDFSQAFAAGEAGKRYFCGVYNGQTPISTAYGYFTVAKALGADDAVADKGEPVNVTMYNLPGMTVDRKNVAPGMYIVVKRYADGSEERVRELVK